MVLIKAIPFALPLEEGDILKRRAAILSELLMIDEGFCSIPVSNIQSETLSRMLALYDVQFFGGWIRKKYPSLSVTLSSRLTSSAGKFLCRKGPFGRITQAEIRMSSDFLLRLDKGPFELNGLSVATAQEAFLVVFEHELCHAAEMVLYGSTGHSQRFLALARGLFGHTATRHKLPTRRQEAVSSGLIVGGRASFPYQGQTITGTITYIGKSATVMVPSKGGEYRDSRGRRYTKYRVPPEKLTPESK